MEEENITGIEICTALERLSGWLDNATQRALRDAYVDGDHVEIGRIISGGLSDQLADMAEERACKTWEIAHGRYRHAH